MSLRDPSVSELKVLIFDIDSHCDTLISSLLQSGTSPVIVALVPQNKREFDIRTSEWLSHLKVSASSSSTTRRPAREENSLSENLNLQECASAMSKGSRSSCSTRRSA